MVADYRIKLKKNDLWHHKLGHVFMQGVIILAKTNFIKRLNFNGDHDVNFSDGCVYPSQKFHFL